MDLESFINHYYDKIPIGYRYFLPLKGFDNTRLAFYVACMFADNIEQFMKFENQKYFINEGWRGNNCFMLSCLKNENLNVIIYLRSLCSNIHKLNNDLSNAFLLACEYNNNIHVIKYLAKDLNISSEIVNNDGHNGFTISCMNNNLNVIKYLVYELSIDVYHKTKDFENGFTLACKYNPDINVIKFLVENLFLYIHQKDWFGIDGLYRALFHNKNYLIFKYLVEDVRMNIQSIGHNFYNIKMTSCLNYLKDFNLIVYIWNYDDNILNKHQTKIKKKLILNTFLLI